jgi:hypothetical protein
LSETRGIAAPRFTIEFPDEATLEAARDTCIANGIARVPEVALEVGDHCELAFVTAAGDDDKPEAVLAGVVTEVIADPLGVVIAIKTRRRRPAASSRDPNAELRGLSVAKAVKLARTAGQRERTVLERTYGKVVWEALLSNPKVTIPEVARIARKRALPQPLLATIVDNPSWSTSPLIRRAALANPRLTTAMATGLLRQTPRNELKLATKQTAYPMAIRELARRLLES